MKSKFKIILFMLLVIIGVYTNNIVNAATYVDTQYLVDNATRFSKPAGHPIGYYVGYNCPAHDSSWHASVMGYLSLRDGRHVYCVEPYVKASEAVGYTGYVGDVAEFLNNTTYTRHPFSMAQWNRAQLIAYYGYGYGGHTDDSWYVATQIMVWKAIDSDMDIGVANSYADAKAGNVNRGYFSSYEAEINNLVNAHGIVPNFNINSKLIITVPSTFYDSNNVLSKYEIIGTNNCTATKNGNSITITPTGVGQISVQLCKGNPNAQGAVLYIGANVQNVALAGEVPVKTNVNAEAIGGRITINKVDKETIVTQGDATFENAIYGIYDGTGKEVTRVTLGRDGSATSNYIPPGTYTVREIQAPRGYIHSEEAYSVNITLDNLNPSVQVSDTVIKGNIEIHKRLDATTYEPEIDLSGVQFKVYLKSNPSFEYYTNISEADGICRVEDLPYGTYVVEETRIPNESLKLEDFEVKIEEDGKTYNYTKVDKSKKVKLKVRKVDIDRTDEDAPDYTQGDAKLEGAVFEIFRDYDCTDLLTTITVDHKDEEGFWCAETGTIRTNTFYAREKTPPEGYLRDYDVYTFEGSNLEQTIELEPKEQTSYETVSRGSLKIVKYDEGNLTGDDKSPAEGAVLRLSLNSNPDKYYEVEISDVGYAEFVEEKSREKYYPFTIPYGDYTITEIRGSNNGTHTHYYSEPEPVTVVRQGQKEYRILEELPVQMYLTLRKLDKDTDAPVNIAGARFKVWNYTKGQWVSMSDGTDEFVTGEDGTVTLPEKLNAGEYIIYEIESPDGYYLQDELRLPENEEDVGKKDKGGKYVKIDKAAMGVEEDATGSVTDLYYIVDLPNEPLKAKLEISKTGEMLTDVSTETTNYGEKYIPKYDQRKLRGVTYELYAASDIMSPDGTQTYITAGTKVDTIKTNENGIALSKDLYLGEYEIREVETPVGYITDNDIPNVTLKNANKTVKVETNPIVLTNERQKLLIGLNKTFKDVNYSASNNLEQKSVFGIYADQDIYNYKGAMVIARNSLVDIVEINGNNGIVNTNVDLPAGPYYIKELEASYPYSVMQDTVDIELNYTNNVDPTVVKETEEIQNDYDGASVSILKLSSSTMSNVLLTGDILDTTNLGARAEEILNNIMNKSDEDILRYYDENKIIFIPGVKYGIYFDKECKKPLYMGGDEGVFSEAKIVTDELGIAKLNDIPIGKYYLKEEEVPREYKLSKDIVELELTSSNKNQRIYRTFINDSKIDHCLTKTDIFTGEKVPNCKFEVRDEDDNLLLSLTTDKEGKGYIPVDIFEDGRTYKYIETDAPDLYKENGEVYKLNSKPIEFVASFKYDENNGVIIEKKTEVSNYRPYSEVEFVKTDLLDGLPIPNCKFELRSLETDFVVEGVTDENGIYVFKDIPYGKYTYTELEAPGYIVNTEPHEIEINTSNTRIEVQDEKQPFTGDIDILTILLIMLSSGLVIYYLYKKRNIEE